MRVIPPIEIKVNVDGDVDRALTELGVRAGTSTDRRVWFAEPRAGGGAPALLSHRIVIRLRSGEQDDLTVKLRPCDREQLVGRWAEPFVDGSLEYRIESDWCGQRRVLSASAVGIRPPGSLLSAALPGSDVTAALESGQRQFLVSCTPPGVAVDRLLALGPIASAKWTDLSFGDLRVDVERWRIAHLDLLELSTRITPEPDETLVHVQRRAEARQRELEAAVRARGMRMATGGTKTERVLTALTARAVRY
ncbi:hypothetical protein [Nocardia bovistercoris]|uniref:CYTH domain-containing protein n=1 Tax=Nocardia bovistercoris TaxID=2785916 RepID=A0A931I732_9NOCA|nr:hypothetical protein [Nocardia bovistercoris]MBH0775261.1 hypothetical protein [Nocardia bovistercoris]